MMSMYSFHIYTYICIVCMIVYIHVMFMFYTCTCYIADSRYPNPHWCFRLVWTVKIRSSPWDGRFLLRPGEP